MLASSLPYFSSTRIDLLTPGQVILSILTSGLPNLFVPLRSLQSLPAHSFPSDLLTLSAATLTNHPSLPSLLEDIRTSAARQFGITFSLASPKITLVGDVPPAGYATTSGERVELEDADVLVRAVSSGDFHATIPGTTLGALSLGKGTPGTVVHDLASSSAFSEAGEGDGVVTVRAAHAAGVSESSVRFESGKATSVVMLRTAREIMRGEVLVPERVFWET